MRIKNYNFHLSIVQLSVLQSFLFKLTYNHLGVSVGTFEPFPIWFAYLMKSQASNKKMRQ